MCMRNVLNTGCLFQILLYFFVCDLFNCAISTTDWIMWNDGLIVAHYKGCERKQLCPNLRYYSYICRMGVRKNHKHQRSVSVGHDLNLEPPEYVAGVYARLWHLVKSYYQTDSKHSGTVLEVNHYSPSKSFTIHDHLPVSLGPVHHWHFK
jgi:hypothetical protein